MAKALDKNIIEEALEGLTGWTYSDDAIHKEFGFNNFKEALGFIVRVGFEAEQVGHHPNLFNVYNTVKISLQTHDAGNKVTKKDLELAKALEAI